MSAGVVDFATASDSNPATEYYNGDGVFLSAGIVDIATASNSNPATEYDDGDGFVMSAGIATAGVCDFWQRMDQRSGHA